MAFGKILGFAALGIGAVALAPFTGGGSIAGATTLAASLAGAEAVAVGAAVVGGAIGAASARKEEEEEEKRNEKISELNKKADKYEKKFKEALNRFKGDIEYFNYIIATTAMGISMANADGEIHPAEKQEINEVIGGIANSNYPQHIKEEIDKLYHNPPNFSTALKYLEQVNPSNFDSIREMLELVMEADKYIHPQEKAFLEAFNREIQNIKYLPEKNDIQNSFLLEIKEKIS